MGIIPKNGEQKETVGVISLLVAHYLLGLGIAVIGQRTKNVMEFWFGIAVFLVAVGALIFFVTAAGSVAAFQASWLGILYGLFSLATWLYIILRLIWIFIKKETKLALF